MIYACTIMLFQFSLMQDNFVQHITDIRISRTSTFTPIKIIFKKNVNTYKSNMRDGEFT